MQDNMFATHTCLVDMYMDVNSLIYMQTGWDVLHDLK